MAKLYFHYSTMNAGKSTLLLQAAYNYRERGMQTLLLTAALDTRAGAGRIASRIGIAEEAVGFTSETDLFALISDLGCNAACIFVDEAQFLTEAQVWQLARVADALCLPVMAYGLRTDFRGQLFPGSLALLAVADDLREVRTICHCGRKATMVVRRGPDGEVMRDGGAGPDRRERKLRLVMPTPLVRGDGKMLKMLLNTRAAFSKSLPLIGQSWGTGVATMTGLR